MPKVTSRFQQLRKEADWSTDELAAMLGMAGGSLRNVEAGREPLGDRRIHRAARLFSAQIHRPINHADLVAEGDGVPDGVPDGPPPQPDPAPKPKSRRKERAGNAPKRPQAERGAA